MEHVVGQQRIWKIAKGGPRARRALYGRHWGDFSEELFVVGGRRTIAKNAFGAQGGGAWPGGPPAYATVVGVKWYSENRVKCNISALMFYNMQQTIVNSIT